MMKIALAAVAAVAVANVALGAYVYKEPMSIDMPYTADIGPGGATFGRAIDPQLRYYGGDNAVYRGNGAAVENPTPSNSNGDSVHSLNVRKIDSAFGFTEGKNFTNSDLIQFTWLVSGDTSGNGKINLYSQEMLEEQELMNPMTGELENVTITVNGPMELVTSMSNPGAGNADFGASLLVTYDTQFSTDLPATCVLTQVLVGAPANNANSFVTSYSYNANQPNSEIGEFTHTGLDLSGPASFGFSMANRGNVLIVGAPDSNAAFVYAKNFDAEACSIGYSLSVSLSGTGQFGFSVDLGAAYYVVGAPTDGDGKVFFYQGSTLAQTVEASSSGTGPTEFGARVYELNDYIFVGAPGGPTGQVLMYRVDPETGMFMFHQELENPSITPGFGTKIESNNCNRVVVGSPLGSNVVQQYNSDLGAYYDDYCTCEFVPVPPFAYPVLETHNVTTDERTCLSVMKTQNWECTMDNPQHLCDYREQTGYIWLNEPHPTESGIIDDCDPVPPGRLVRKRVFNNCMRTYTIPFSV
eukprot:CAMPEP_0185848550 /NCGR_PEP_ID=MMETSP1354-20130828/3361_1 /TAXON_ID=708628 /ORGANISM="Erythrolobus madagascarensis, Strain CCMP3276" /LENGTH=524 /DNA_ID=CAMNT_0028548957 /DNA_START=52 /DNA_END=1626 /DNA_ORIENTATION=-